MGQKLINMSLKRKASVLGLGRSPNKVRKSPEDTQPQYGALEQCSTVQANEVTSDDELMPDSDQPDGTEEAIRTATMQESSQLKNEVPRRPARPDPKAAERAERWEELVFIVFAKDNFQQDPSMPAGHSTTSGPLTNAQLKDAYCNRFNKEVGAEAAMKRYRIDKQKVYDAYPKHPRSILYAPKQNKSKRPRLGKVINLETERTDAKESTERDRNHINTVEAKQETKERKNTEVPQISEKHRRNIEAADVRRYVESSWEIPENEHQPWVRILLADSCDRIIGACSIGAEDLKSSLAYVEYRQHTNVRELWLTGVARVTLQRYFQCLSPLRLSKLPQCDFTLILKGPEPTAAVASCERIVWDFQATLDIYELATQLRDCHVRNLVMDHWREQLQVNHSYEVGLIEMQLLYDRLSTDDPALQFWTQALQELLPMDDSRKVIDFIDSPSSTGFFVANRRKIESDKLFHYQYHRCPFSNHKDVTCDHIQHSYGDHTEALYSLDHFNQIARRLLLSESWQETDWRLKIAEAKLELEFFNTFSLL